MTAESSAEALDRVTGTTPDVLLLDLGLPGEDGYTLLRRIRAMSQCALMAVPQSLRIKIVEMTNRAVLKLSSVALECLPTARAHTKAPLLRQVQ
jgi:CheY-like chemotaxis protein